MHCVPWMLMPLPVTHCQTTWGCATSCNVAASSAFSNHKLCCQLQVAALQNTPTCPLPPLPMLHPCAPTTHFSSLLGPVGVLCLVPAHGTFPHGIYGARTVKGARGMHSQSSTAQASCSCMGCRAPAAAATSGPPLLRCCCHYCCFCCHCCRCRLRRRPLSHHPRPPAMHGSHAIAAVLSLPPPPPPPPGPPCSASCNPW